MKEKGPNTQKMGFVEHRLQNLSNLQEIRGYCIYNTRTDRHAAGIRQMAPLGN